MLRQHNGARYSGQFQRPMYLCFALGPEQLYRLGCGIDLGCLFAFAGAARQLMAAVAHSTLEGAIVIGPLRIEQPVLRSACALSLKDFLQLPFGIANMPAGIGVFKSFVKLCEDELLHLHKATIKIDRTHH